MATYDNATFSHKKLTNCFFNRYNFLKCDVRIWTEQLAVFKAAKENSPHKSIDIVVANAGISDLDPVFQIGT